MRRQLSELRSTCGYKQTRRSSSAWRLEGDNDRSPKLQLGHVIMADLGEFGNEPSSFIKRSLFWHQSEYQLPKKYSAGIL
jgi:hypothetical protein